jgi:hypothetical protein
MPIIGYHLTARSTYSPTAITAEASQLVLCSTRSGEGVDLEVGLLVGGGDAGIAEQISHAADHLKTL